VARVGSRTFPTLNHSSQLEADANRKQPTGVPQYSHLFNPEHTLSYSISGHAITLRGHSGSANDRIETLPTSTTIFDHLSSLQSKLQSSTQVDASPLPSIPVGFVGYINYEMKAVTLPLSKPSTARNSDEATKEEEYGTEFAFASKVLSYEHETERWYASGLVRLGEGDGEDRLGIEEEDWDAWISQLQQHFADVTPTPTSLISPIPLPSTFVPDQSRESYISSIESARSSIILGNAYELCLTTQFRASLPPDSPLLDNPYPLYLSLRATNPAPYSAFFNLPKSNLTILSSSPERFLRSSSSGKVSMKPIKGTVRRCLEDLEEDERRKRTLEADEKERAENLMIVDLIRNDLLGFCEVESVEVTGLMKIESYETVHQWV